MRNKLIIAVIAIVAFIGFVWFIVFFNPHELRVKVNQVDKIEKISGDKGRVSTYIYYMLYTDKGAFRIYMDGLVAHPEFVGVFKKDSVYEITVCGVECPFAGMYRNVVGIKK